VEGRDATEASNLSDQAGHCVRTEPDGDGLDEETVLIAAGEIGRNRTVWFAEDVPKSRMQVVDLAHTVDDDP
jgi:hypothetical protein